MNPVVLLSAAKFEAEPTIKILEQSGIGFDYVEIGIGAVNAAKTSSRLELKGRSVIFVGSCGAFGTFPELTVVSVKRCLWSPYAVRAGDAELIEGVEPEILFENLSPYAKTLKLYTAICSSAITTQDKHHPKEELSCENLELYSVARELSQAKSLSIFLGITNQVCMQGRQQWRENFNKIAVKTSENIETMIRGDYGF